MSTWEDIMEGPSKLLALFKRLDHNTTITLPMLVGLSNSVSSLEKKVESMSTSLNDKVANLASVEDQVLQGVKEANTRIAASNDSMTKAQANLQTQLNEALAQLATAQAAMQAAPVDTSAAEAQLDTITTNMNNILAMVRGIDPAPAVSIDPPTSTASPAPTPTPAPAPEQTGASDGVATQDDPSTPVTLVNPGVTNTVTTDDVSAAPAHPAPGMTEVQNPDPASKVDEFQRFPAPDDNVTSNNSGPVSSSTGVEPTTEALAEPDKA